MSLFKFLVKNYFSVSIILIGTKTLVNLNKILVAQTDLEKTMFARKQLID